MNARFTVVPVRGGWQIYDTERREHLGAVRKRRTSAENVLRDIQQRPPHIARFILTGSTR